MKKILILPALLMSMLTGCSKEEEKIYTPIDWFKDTDVIENEMEFFVGARTEKDYDKKVAEEMFSDFKYSFDKPKKIDEPQRYALMYYSLKKNLGPYREYTMYFHEGYIETKASGSDNKKYIEQCAVYKCDYSNIAYLMDFSSRRISEIDNVQSEEYKVAKADCSFENFYQQIEESTTDPTVILNNTSKKDVNHALLDDIKGLFNPYSEKAYSGSDLFLLYGLNENFMLKFYLCDHYTIVVAILEYQYQSTLGYTESIRIGYKVSRKDVDNLVDKINAIENQ